MIASKFWISSFIHILDACTTAPSLGKYGASSEYVELISRCIVHYRSMPIPISISTTTMADWSVRLGPSEARSKIKQNIKNERGGRMDVLRGNAAINFFDRN